MRKAVQRRAREALAADKCREWYSWGALLGFSTRHDWRGHSPPSAAQRLPRAGGWQTEGVNCAELLLAGGAPQRRWWDAMKDETGSDDTGDVS